MPNKVEVIAHRGAWKEADLPQNSIASLQRAGLLGCAGSEFDVQMTADEIPVVHHDADFYGLEIERLPYRQLLTKKHPNGESLPTLDEYLRAGIKQLGTKLVLEIKPSGLGAKRALALAEKVVEKVRELDAQDWIEYISFDYEVLQRVLALDALAHVSYLKGDKAPSVLQGAGFSGLDYHFAVLLARPAWVSQAREMDLVVNTWTVNNKAMMRLLRQAGVDCITTDEPGVLLEMQTKR